MFYWLLCLMGRHDWSRWYAGQRHCKRCFVLETRPYKKRVKIPSPFTPEFKEQLPNNSLE